MAHLQKLSIQGVRSFDPDTCQEIKFFPRSITLILGPNGAGKTTVIESLKYAATGNLPPNCNMGRSFVHDVQFANQAIIRGQIRLRFTDVENKSTVITRSMQTSCKKSKTSNPTITFKQMNQVIKREGKSIDQKCADVNNEVVELIGVSKALLNNVIFCHQEETNWPLSEGKVLKEKFDDIFGSIGYVKMLEKIKKTRDEEVKKFKLLEKDVRFFEHLKKEAEVTRKELNEENAQIDIEKAKVKELETKIKTVKERLDELNDKQVDAQDINNSISTIEGKINEQRRSAKNIENQIKKSPEILSKSEEEVNEELEHFDENGKKLIAKKGDLKDKLTTLHQAKELIQVVLFNNNEKAKFDDLKNQREDKLNEINEIKQKLSQVLSENGVDPENLSNTFSEAVKRKSDEHYQLIKKVSVLESKLAVSKSKLESQQKQLSQRIKELDSNKSKFDGICNFETFEEFIEEKEAELNNLRDEKSKKSCQAPVIDSHVETIMTCDMCPVCEKDLSSEWTSKKTAGNLDKQSLIENLKKSTVNSIEEVKQLGAQIQSSEQMCAKLRKLRSNYDAIQNITNEILSIKSVMPSYREQVSALEKTIEEERSNLNASKEKVESLRGHDCEVSNYANERKSLAVMDRKLGYFKPKDWENDAHLDEINSYFKILQINIQLTDVNFSELLETIEEKKIMYKQQLAETEKEITNRELRKRELKDRKDLITLQKEISETEAQLSEERRKLNSMNFNSIKEASEKTSSELATMKAKITFSKERIRETYERISKLTDKLSGNYEKAEANYKEKLVEMIVTELATSDLNKYYKALDYSISSFHKCKMEEINKLLKSFWEIAYQGKDIDYIMIASDEEERSASDKRRTYNYRVVMMKKGKEMDMKGRCSAGQKVLASLVIRLALAVIFCKNFAVLTLDEPTTNLDRANIHSFARAIVSLIRSNRNFQIVIITHDEQFLECFDGALGEFYYKISKNDSGYSVITREPINDDSQIIPSVPQLDDGAAQSAKTNNKRNNETEGDVALEMAPKRIRKD